MTSDPEHPYTRKLLLAAPVADRNLASVVFFTRRFMPRPQPPPKHRAEMRGGGDCGVCGLGDMKHAKAAIPTAPI